MVAEVKLERVQAELIDEQAMFRVLASLGTQTAAFVHEVSAALGSVGSLKRAIDAMLRHPPGPAELTNLQRRVDALQRTLERQSAYLVEIVSPDARLGAPVVTTGSTSRSPLSCCTTRPTATGSHCATRSPRA